MPPHLVLHSSPLARQSFVASPGHVAHVPSTLHVETVPGSDPFSPTAEAVAALPGDSRRFGGTTEGGGGGGQATPAGQQLSVGTADSRFSPPSWQSMTSISDDDLATRTPAEACWLQRTGVMPTPPHLFVSAGGLDTLPALGAASGLNAAQLQRLARVQCVDMPALSPAAGVKSEATFASDVFMNYSILPTALGHLGTAEENMEDFVSVKVDLLTFILLCNPVGHAAGQDVVKAIPINTSFERNGVTKDFAQHCEQDGIRKHILWTDVSQTSTDPPVVTIQNHDGRHRAKWLLSKGFKFGFVQMDFPVQLDGDPDSFISLSLRPESLATPEAKARTFSLVLRNSVWHIHTEPAPKLEEFDPELAAALQQAFDGSVNTAAQDAVVAPNSSAGQSSSSIRQPESKKKRLPALVDGAPLNTILGRPATVTARSLAPTGFPMGPFDSELRMFDSVALFATHPGTSQGGFGVKFANGGHAATSKSGHRRLVSCKDGKDGKVCPWHVSFEQSESGYVLRDGGWEHNHELRHSVVEALAAGSDAAAMPAEYKALAQLHARSGGDNTASAVVRLLAQKAAEDKIPVLWNYKTVWDIMAPHRSSKTLDASNLLEELEVRKAQGLASFFRTNADAQLISVFWECYGAMEVWSESRNTNVVMFDPTYNTNAHGLQLSAFTTIDKHGRTKILAISLFTNADEVTFTWLFQKFVLVFRIPPAVILTDGDLAMGLALGKLCKPGHEWALCVHLLCIYHISKNLYKHLHPLFTNQPIEWKRVHDDFWVLAKDTAQSTQDTWDDDWQVFTDNALRCLDSSGPKFESAKSFLTSLGESSHKWAYRFTWSHLTYGASATQRAEMVQAVLKTFLSATTLLTDLLRKSDAHNEQMSTQGEATFLRHIGRSMAQRDKGQVPQVLVPLQKVLTPYAYRLVELQHQQALNYRVQDSAAFPTRNDQIVCLEPIEVRTHTSTGCSYGEDGRITDWCCEVDIGVRDTRHTSWAVSIDDCPCQWSKHFGLICRHKLFLLMLSNMSGGTLTLDLDAINPKWKVRTASQSKTLLTDLIRTPCPSILVPEASAAQRSAEDRFKLAVQQMQQLAHVASLTESSYASLLSCLPSFMNALKGKDDGKSVETGKSAQSLSKILLAYSTAPCPLPPLLDRSDEASRQLIGRDIAYKWSGMWWRGKITKYAESDDLIAIPDMYGDFSLKPSNFFVVYHDDDAKVSHALHARNYGLTSTYEHTWYLLEQADSSTAPALVGAPPREVTVGRPENKRRAPQHGPTSRRPRRN